MIGDPIVLLRLPSGAVLPNILGVLVRLASAAASWQGRMGWLWPLIPARPHGCWPIMLSMLASRSPVIPARPYNLLANQFKRKVSHSSAGVSATSAAAHAATPSTRGCCAPWS